MPISNHQFVAALCSVPICICVSLLSWIPALLGLRERGAPVASFRSIIINAYMISTLVLGFFVCLICSYYGMAFSVVIRFGSRVVFSCLFLFVSGDLCLGSVVGLLLCERKRRSLFKE